MNRITISLLLSAVLATAPVAFAQSVTGQVSGTVADPQGAVVAGATVRLTNEVTQQVREFKTETSGTYVFTNLVAGTYGLNVEHDGFKAYDQKSIVLGAAERLALREIRLEVGSVNTTVEVTSDAARVQTASSERAGLVNPTQIENTPTRGRDYLSLLKVLPGVVSSDRDAPGIGAASAIVNGGRAGQPLVTLDGVASQDTGGGVATGGYLSPSIDAIGEVKILLSNYQAEYGARAGGTMNVIIKSGTTQFHGSGYYFKRNEAFNANNWFNNAQNFKRPLYRYDNPGYTVGGPVIIPGTRFNQGRNKLFFFWSHDIFVRNVPSSLTGTTVPTNLERQGDFSQTVDGVTGNPIVIRDPVSQAPFPGNKIPQSQRDPAGQIILNAFPKAFTSDATGRRQYNTLYQYNYDMPHTDKILRMDYNVSSKTLVYGRFMNDYENTVGYGGGGGLGASLTWPQMMSDYSIQSLGLVGTVVHTFRPTLINEFTWGLNTAHQNVGFNDAELARNTRKGWGLSASILPELYPSANELGLIPNLSFGAGSGGGAINNPVATNFEYRFPFSGTNRIQNITDNVSWVKGAHNLKFGIYYERTVRDANRGGSFNGTYNYGSTNLNSLDSGQGFANALLGVVQSYQESNIKPKGYARYANVEWFAQDNWKVSRRLTIDVGVRFQFIGPVRSQGNDLSDFDWSLYDSKKIAKLIGPTCASTFPCSGVNRLGLDPVTNTTVPAALIGAYAPNSGTPYQGTRIYHTEIFNKPPIGVGPRFGFAYDVFGNGKMAVRGGFGVTYDKVMGDGNIFSLIEQAPNQLTPQILYVTVPQLLGSTAYLTPSLVRGVQRDYSLPATYSWSLGIQRDIGFGVVLDVAYAGNAARHMFNTIQTNELPYGATSDANGVLVPSALDKTTNLPYPINFLRPILGQGQIQYYRNDDTSNYQSMQAQANRRFGKKLLFGASWTWSKVMSYARSPYVADALTYGPDANNRSHIVNVNWTYSLPGASRLWGNAVTKRALDGWQITGFYSFVTGSPLSPSYSYASGTAPAGVTTTGSPSALLSRIQLVGDPILLDSQRVVDRGSMMNPAAFAMPAVAAFGIGNAPKVVFYGVPTNNFDVSLFKMLSLGKEGRSLELRAETYNTFNHIQFNNPSTAAQFNFKTGALANGPGSPTGTFGLYTSARDPRRMVLAAKIRF